MTVAIMAIGMPGSGKTSTLKPFAERHGFVYINRDDIRAELTGNPGDRSRNPEVWALAKQRAAEALARGESVVLDSTFVERWKRREMAAFVRARGAARVIGVLADVPLDIAKSRNRERGRTVVEHALEWMHDLLTEEPPSLEDGFDAIVGLQETDRLETLLAA